MSNKNLAEFILLMKRMFSRMEDTTQLSNVQSNTNQENG